AREGGRRTRRRQRRPRRLVSGAPVSPRRAAEPSMERAPERARILVPQEKCDRRDGELAVAQERLRHFTAELGEQRRERRPFLAQLALERPVAHAQRPGQTRQGWHAFGQLDPQRPAHPPPTPALTADAPADLRGEG